MPEGREIRRYWDASCFIALLNDAAEAPACERILDQARGCQTEICVSPIVQAAPNLAAVPTDKPVRRHLLKGNRAGQFAVDLVHPYRLVFKPNHAPVPLREDGGIDTERVTAITIIDVVDYH